ncbi:MAG TPA: hypothetical protein VFC44_01335 [Candidatus Saccharimonadales bacterium]|nr:hypothetical protein [Candidatus Saccharimonadales bacterium]
MNRNITALLFSAAILCGAHLHGSSLLDPTFDPGSGANGLIETVLTQPNGKILICGNFTVINGVTNSYIARLNSDGSVDTSFSAKVSYWVRTMSLQPDGKIVIGGFFTSVAGQSRHLVARLNSDGSLDATFDPGSGAVGILGIAVDGDADPFIFATALQSDGKILITGNFTNYNGVNINGIARLTSTGGLDTSFNVGAGLNSASWGRSLTVQANGQILVTGWFTSYDNQSFNRMVRLNPDGTADQTFHPYFGDLTAVYGAVELPNQQYVVVGDSQNTNVYFIRDMAQINSDGSFDTSFLAVSTDKTESVRRQTDGKILIGGYFSRVDGSPRTSIARLNADGSLDETFGATVDNFIWSMDIQPSGRILIAGGFQNIDGVSRSGIARLLPSTNGVQAASTNGPAIKILQPAAAVSRVYTDTATLKGTAKSPNGVVSVVVSSLQGVVAPSTGTTNWSAVATLAPGTNIITIAATDSSGKTSVTTREFIYAAHEMLTITNTVGGTITPRLNGRVLLAATTYTVAAVPAPGYVFNGWTGTLTSSAATLRFVMQPGMTLQANFIPNPFLAHTGTSQGLAYNPSSVTNASAGFFVLTLGAKGSYSAQLMWVGVTYRWSGQFSNNLGAQEIIPRRGTTPINVSLQFQNGNLLAGTISAGNLTASVMAYTPGFGRTNPATNYAGQYTVLLPGGSGSSPSGDGYMTLTVTTLGEAETSGMLADGVSFARNVPLGPNGLVPVYYSYNKGTAAVFGWLTVSGMSSTSVQGSFHWEKTPSFGEDIEVIGDRYTRAAGSAPEVKWTNAVATLSSGGLAASIMQSFTLNSGNKFAFMAPNTNRFALRLNPANGVLAGTFLDPATRRTTTLRGVILQSQATAGGFFVSGASSGQIIIGPSAATP